MGINRTRIAALLVAANVAVIFSFWWTMSGELFALPWSSGGPAIALGRITGLLLQCALLIQLVLIGRIPFIERGVGFDRLNRLHRLIGYSLVILLILHPLLLSIGYGALGGHALPGAFVGLVRGFDEVLQAVLGALTLLGVIALSVPWVRRRLRYESWHGLHLATYLAMWLSFSHQVESGGDFANQSLYIYWYALNGGVVGLYFLYRFLRPFALWYRHRFVVDRVVQESPDAWSIYISGRHIDAFRFEPGQFANLHLLAEGLWAGHPFSFSSEYNGSTLRFTAKALGDGTGLISRLKPGTSVLIDGPLGAFTPARARTGKYLLIAGGIGVTPIRAIAGALSAMGADTVILYAARARAHTALLDELRSRIRRVYLFLSQENAQSSAEYRHGQIDAAAIRQLVPDAAQRDAFICGPTPMMDHVTAALREVGVPLRQIHSERFGY